MKLDRPRKDKLFENSTISYHTTRLRQVS